MPRLPSALRPVFTTVISAQDKHEIFERYLDGGRRSEEGERAKGVLHRRLQISSAAETFGQGGLERDRPDSAVTRPRVLRVK